MNLRFFCIFALIHSAVCSDGYYWRAYEPNHSIPSDAVQAGLDLSLANLYIGQTNIWPHAGVHPTTITPGEEVWAPYRGPKHAISFIQILCSENRNKFKWLPATSRTLHLVGINTQIVTGGLDRGHITYIGRVKHQGTVVIGPVNTHDINNSFMVFVFNNREVRATSYEILTYEQ